MRCLVKLLAYRIRVDPEQVYCGVFHPAEMSLSSKDEKKLDKLMAKLSKFCDGFYEVDLDNGKIRFLACSLDEIDEETLANYFIRDYQR